MIPDSTLSEESATNALFIDLLNRLGEARIRVTGSSMRPAIAAGDVLTVRQSRAGDAHPGDVVLFTRDGRLFAHRVVARATDGKLVTRGDSLGSEDPPVADGEFLGRVASVDRPSLVRRILRRGQQLRRRLVAA